MVSSIFFARLKNYVLPTRHPRNDVIHRSPRYMIIVQRTHYNNLYYNNISMLLCFDVKQKENVTRDIMDFFHELCIVEYFYYIIMYSASRLIRWIWPILLYYCKSEWTWLLKIYRVKDVTYFSVTHGYKIYANNCVKLI